MNRMAYWGLVGNKEVYYIVRIFPYSLLILTTSKMANGTEATCE